MLSVLLSVTFYVECRYAGCRYVECQGANSVETPTGLLFKGMQLTRGLYYEYITIVI
jgi:hypothetical protein